MHELITYPGTPLPHLALTKALLQSFGVVWVFGHELLILASPCNKPFSAPNSDVSVSFGLTVRQAHELAFGNLNSSMNSISYLGGIFQANTERTSLTIKQASSVLAHTGSLGHVC